MSKTMAAVRMTNAQIARAKGKERISFEPARSKYNARRRSCGLHDHDSTKEAIRCGDLQLLQKAHQISGLRTQVRFRLTIGGVKLCDYIADFVYLVRINSIPARIVEDCKGVRTEVYQLKKKLMRAIHGINIVET